MVIDQKDFDVFAFDDIPVQVRKKGNQNSSQKYYYKDIITAFDIETTYIKEIDNSVMYIWQWQFGDLCTVIGRTWYELKLFTEKLEEHLDGLRLICFVHNLSFEFEYLSGIYDFSPEDVFAVDDRKILKALLHDKIEFRCSYLQTNMSLRAFCEKMSVKNYKLKLDYSKRRYWYTPLSPKELAYCVNDVRGLVQAIKVEMERDKDNLYTLPLTSTGYSRRDAKKAMRKVSKAYIQNQAPDYQIYQLLRDAFRGGNTHSSRHYSNKHLTNVFYKSDFHSCDISSAYPDAIVNDAFPVSKFIIKENCSLEQLNELIYDKHRAVIIKCSLFDVELKNDLIPVPYLATSKCKGILDGVYDNGRILKAKIIHETVITDIDLEILHSQYKFEMELITVASARYGKLPAPLREVVLSYYKDKTQLKDKPSDEEHTAAFYELLYGKKKALLNAQYGLFAQQVKQTIKYVNKRGGPGEPDHLFLPSDEKTMQELLEEHNKKAFLVYQWGCWVTCHCRKKLQVAIDACKEGFIYCDTDSCKYIGDVDWDKINMPYLKRSEKAGAFAYDPKGKKHIMGIFEKEPDMIEFKTMGSKKYAYRDAKGELHITIAGVNKSIGAIELERAGGLKAMVKGFKFKYAGGLEARYKDFPDISEWINEDGVPIRITRNVSLVRNTKTLNLTPEYEELLNKYITYNSVDL